MKKSHPEQAVTAQRESQTNASPRSSDFTSVLERNINVMRRKRQERERNASLRDRTAETITRFTGSMTFAGIHLLIVAGWVAVNLDLIPGIRPFDPTFVMLATAASVEAIFLSTFVLISQNRAAAEADRRAELDLQTNLLSEHEITRLLSLMIAVAQRLGVQEAQDPSLRELERHVAPEKVLDRLDEEGDGPPSQAEGDPGEQGSGNPIQTER